MGLEVPEYRLFGQEEGHGHGEELPALDEDGVVGVELGVGEVHEGVGRRGRGCVAQEPVG